MDQIKKAIERSKTERLPDIARAAARPSANGTDNTAPASSLTFRALKADPVALEEHRIVAHTGSNPLSIGIGISE